MKPEARRTGLSSRVATLLVLCGWCVGMGVGVPVAKADIVPPPSGLPSGEGSLQVTMCLAGAAWANTTPSPLVHEFYTDKDTYLLGEQVDITYVIENAGDEEYTFCRGPGPIFVVQRDGDEIWRSADGTIQGCTAYTMAPGEIIEYASLWDMTNADEDPVGPGRYQVIAVTMPVSPVGITIVPEPCVSLLVSVGFVFLVRRNRRGP